MDTKLMQYRKCECGCGKQVKQYSDGRQRRYAKGHKSGIVYKGTTDLIETKCGYCHQAISVERWRIDRFGINFCSREHQKRYRSLQSIKELTCEFCGKKFMCLPCTKQGKHIFCSLGCSAKFNALNRHGRITVTCDQCGKEIETHICKQKINKHFFCSIGCHKLFIMGTNNPAYRSGWGRKREYSANWKSQRRAAIIRDGGRCQVCNKTPKKSRYLHVHHIQPAYTFNGNWEQANDLTNLISLCGTCHKKVERGIIPVQPKIF